MPSRPMRVILFSDARPQLVWRLAERIEQEARGTTVCGLVCDRSSPRRWPGRERIRTAVRRAVDLALRWAHGCPRNPNGPADFTDEELVRRSRTAGWPILMMREPGSGDAYDFVRQQDADLGVCLQTGALREELLRAPRLGSVVAQGDERLPPGTGSGSLARARTGADELPREVKIEVVRVEKAAPRVTLGCLALSSEPYETPISLGLKRDLITNDLLVRSVANLVAGGESGLQGAVGCPTWTPLPAAASAADPPTAGRPRWKMCLYAVALAPYWIARNWYRRLRGRCPVIILFHHLAADRPHHLGMPTESFFAAVRFLQRHYRVLSLREAVESLASGSVRVPSVVLTLDDGYRENFLTVRAVMEETGVPLTFFVNPELIDQRRPCPHDVARGQSQFLPLSWEQLAYLARNGAEVGSHTRTHFDCGSGDREALESEIIGSKRDLEHRLARPVRFFAFPWGQPRNMSREATAMATATYSRVFSAYGGENLPGRPDLSGTLLRQFQSSDLWELELSLQSVFDLASSLRRAVVPRPTGRAQAVAYGRDASKGVAHGA